jgi:exodeoxyribonuclease VII large subunit
MLVNEQEQKLDRQIGKLDALSPLKVMKRGYSLVFKEADGKQNLVTAVEQTAAGEKVAVRLADGTLVCRVEETQKGDIHG